ncbi:MAG: hypothetical protein ABIT71_08015 [Vicinamibacteraceae bacterium]
MSVATTILLDRLSALVGLFDRGSLDLPDGTLTHDTSFRLNGVAYDAALGRPAGDPLARLVARGSGGYRFLFKALRFALPDARLDVGALERTSLEVGCRLAGPARLDGTLRGTGEAFSSDVHLSFTFDDLGRLSAIDADLDPAQVARIQAARLAEATA